MLGHVVDYLTPEFDPGMGQEGVWLCALAVPDGHALSPKDVVQHQRLLKAFRPARIKGSSHSDGVFRSPHHIVFNRRREGDSLDPSPNPPDRSAKPAGSECYPDGEYQESTPEYRGNTHTLLRRHPRRCLCQLDRGHSSAGFRLSNHCLWRWIALVPDQTADPSRCILNLFARGSAIRHWSGRVILSGGGGILD